MGLGFGMQAVQRQFSFLSRLQALLMSVFLVYHPPDTVFVMQDHFLFFAGQISGLSELLGPEMGFNSSDTVFDTRSLDPNLGPVRLDCP